MGFFTELGIGVSSYVKVPGFISRHKLWGVLTWPTVFNLILVALLLWGTLWLGGELWEYLTGWMETDTEAETWYGKAWSWILGGAGAIFKWIIRVLCFLIVYYVYQYVALIILSPVYAYVAEKVQQVIMGQKFAFNMNQLLSDIRRGIGLAIRNLFVELLIIAGVSLLYCLPIPFLGFFISLFIFFVGAFYYGFSMIDYHHELRRYSSRDSRKLVLRHKGVATGNGLVFHFLLLIPVVGTLFAPTFSIIAAGLAMEEVNPYIGPAQGPAQGLAAPVEPASA